MDLLARAFADAPVGMAISAVHADGRLRTVQVNAELCALLRATAAQVYARRPADLVVAARRPAALALYAPLLSGAAARVRGELELQRGDGTVFTAEITAARVPGGDLAAPTIVTHVQDVDERVRSQRRVGEAERRFRTVFEDGGLPTVLFDPDRRIVRVNRALCDLLGCREEDVVGHDSRIFLHADQHAIVDDHMSGLLAAEGPDRYRRDGRYVTVDGRTIWATATASLVRADDGAPQYIVVQFVDRTVERAAQAEAERRLAQQTAVAWLGQRALAEDGLDPLLDAAVSVLAATCGTPYAALAVVEPDGGLCIRSAVGWETGERVDPDPTGSLLAHTLGADGPVVVQDAALEHRFSTLALIEDGIASAIAVVVAGEAGEPYAVLSLNASERNAFSTADIAFVASVANVLTAAVRRDAAARNLRHQSLHDPLTGLPNRGLLLDRLRQAMARGRRDGTTLAVLFCDIDDFKYVNDTLGHDAGDRLLAALAPRLATALRTTDTLARFGGDEFVALCEGLADPSEAIAVAERLLDAAAEVVDLGGHEFVPTASIGVAFAQAGGDSDPEALLRDADVAMYGAKNGGKGRFELFDAQMRQQSIDRVGLLGGLRQAVAGGELVLEFQPVVSLRRREVAGLEALVRWNHPRRGRLMPDQFIGLAEDSALIGDIGRWVIHEAVARTAAWKAAKVPVLERVRTAVNVSWRQISHGTLVDDVRAALEYHRLDPATLCVEITESAIMEDPERARAVLGELAGLGVHLALDDFGTGHSSLAVLRGFPFDTIKLDRAFLAGEDWPVVRAVTQMARSLDLLVVAEGIERSDQEAHVVDLDCDFGQGWLYARALDARELEGAALALEANLRAAGPGAAGRRP